MERLAKVHLQQFAVTAVVSERLRWTLFGNRIGRRWFLSQTPPRSNR